MKSFYDKRYLSAAAAILSAFVLSVACTSVDDTLAPASFPAEGTSFPSTSTRSDWAKANG